MKPIEEALKLESLDEINAEIKERRELIYQMVGRLYPSILNSEITKLIYRKADIERELR